MIKQQCVGPTGQWQEKAPSHCPTRPKFQLRHGDIEVWACERHLPQAVTGFQTQTPIEVRKSK